MKLKPLKARSRQNNCVVVPFLDDFATKNNYDRNQQPQQAEETEKQVFEDCKNYIHIGL